MKKSREMKIWAVVVWLIIWQIASMAIGHSFILASPVDVILRGFSLVQTWEFWSSVFLTTGKIALGYILAMAGGIVLAILGFKQRRFREFITPLMVAIKTVPVVSFIILALIFMSSRYLSILIAFLIALPIIYSNTLTGIEEADGKLLEMAKIFRLSKGGKVRHIFLPSVLPYLSAAAKTACGMAWKAGIAGEVIGTPAGSIGEYLQRAKVYLETPDLFAWTLVIILLSILMEKVVLKLMDVITGRMMKKV